MVVANGDNVCRIAQFKLNHFCWIQLNPVNLHKLFVRLIQSSIQPLLECSRSETGWINSGKHKTEFIASRRIQANWFNLIWAILLEFSWSNWDSSQLLHPWWRNLENEPWARFWIRPNQLDQHSKLSLKFLPGKQVLEMAQNDVCTNT